MEENSRTKGAGSVRRVFWKLVAWGLAPAVLGILVFCQNKMFRDATCETYDEFTYLRMGICLYRDGDFQSLGSPMCPPLPILLQYWLPALSTSAIPGTDAWNLEVPRLTRQARFLTSILIGIPTVWLIYAWLVIRRGWVVGLLGGGMVALSPSVLAASSIATTDACFVLFALVALAAMHLDQGRSSRASYLLAGAAIGLALGSKQSAVLLFGTALVELFLESPGRKPGATRIDLIFSKLFWVGVRLGGLIALAFLVDSALYGFRLAAPCGRPGTQIPFPVIIPMITQWLPDGDRILEAARRIGPPLAIDTFYGQIMHASEGHHAFLMGEYSFRGWWYFFPVAIAIKSTPAELVMIALVLILACRPATWRDPSRRLWLVSAAILLGLGIASKINIGHRYMLLIYPLVTLIVADWLGQLAHRGPVRAIAAGLLLLTWQAISVAGITPYYLSYFNSIIGGPSQGYHYLVDSSLDWGQDLPSLRRELEARGYRKVALTYFGTANPQTYGIRQVDWLTSNNAEALECDWLAISATAFQGPYAGASRSLRQRFGDLPAIRAGYSIFLYDLKDARVRSAWDADRATFGKLPVAPPSPP